MVYNKLKSYIDILNDNFKTLCSSLPNQISCQIISTKYNVLGIYLHLRIENKKLFKKGHCGAITSKGHQCSRKVKRKEQFCGLHNSSTPSRYITNNNNISHFTYNFTRYRNDNIINKNNVKTIYYQNKEFLHDQITNELWFISKTKTINMGNINSYNIQFI